MTLRISIAGSALVLAFAAALAVAPAAAQPGGDPPRRHAPSASDTTEAFPVWLHPWLEIGGGWLAGPAYMRHFYDSGQGFAAGLALQPRSRLQFRAAIDYQMLVSHHTENLIIDWGYVDASGHEALDTLNYSFDSNAWNALLRAETGVELGLGLWLTGGLGAGYMNGGFQDYANIPGSGFRNAPPESMRNGWGWAWTAAARWDFEPDPLLPFGIDVRSTGLKRGDATVHWWSVRLTYRIPDVSRKGGTHP